MKTIVLLSTFLVTMLIFPFSMQAQLSFTTTAAATIDFTNTVAGINNGAYLGTGLASSPAAGQLDSDGITVTGISDLMGGSISSASGTPSPSDALYAVTDGGDTWFGLSPGGSWSVVLQIDNDIPATSIYSLNIDFDIRFRNTDIANQTYTLEFATSALGPWSQIGSSFNIPFFVPVSTNWEPFAYPAGVVCMGNIASGTSVFLRLTGTGTSTDAIAFNSVAITPITTALCTLTNITSFATANVEDVTLDLNWMEDGSGDCSESYLVVGREGVAPASDLIVSNLQGLYEAGDFTANTDWSARSNTNEIWNQTTFTLGADEVDYFVYKGSGTSVSISGLDQNTNYNFLIMATGEKCSWLVGSNVNTMTLLPIELVSFTGQAREKDILLEWRTETEINNDYMIVERSSDGVHFFDIGRVEGAGNSQVPQEYAFTDQAPLQGINYYRLKQVDFDGTHTYYRVISVDYESALIAWQVSPTHTSDQLFANTSKPFEVGSYFKIIDLYGRVLQRINAEEGLVRQSIDVSKLMSGPYFLQLNNQGKIDTKRFIKRW